MMRILKTMTILVVCVDMVVAVAAGRRRRRNTYNDRPCVPGQYAILTPNKKYVASCEQCPENTYRTDAKHSEEACLSCESGRVSSGDYTFCFGDVCNAGKYGTVGSNTCKVCLAGQYSTIGQFSCKKCESGRHSATTGQDNCFGEMCPAGKFGLDGQYSTTQATCSVCPAGTWSSIGSAECTGCNNKSYSQANAASCKKHDKCPNDSYYEEELSKTTNNARCTRCIYASVMYSSGYFFACMVSAINTSMFVYDHKKNCYLLLFILVSGVWAIVLSNCSSKPQDDTAIASIIMNTMCLQPAFGKLMAMCKKYLRAQKQDILDMQKSNGCQMNEQGRDMATV
jgi:hypothetical protein